MQALVAAGLTRAGLRCGGSYAVQRPTGPFDPVDALAVANVVGIFDPDPAFRLVAVEERRAAVASFLGDCGPLLHGDYLVGAETWFVSRLEKLRAASCTRCNAIVTVKSPASRFTTGSAAYGGRLPSTDVVVARNWPASLLDKSHVEMNAARLPTDVRTNFVEILLPPVPNTAFTHGQMVSDACGQTYIVSGAELSASGWRLVAGLETT